MAYAPSKVSFWKGIFKKLPCTGLQRSATPICMYSTVADILAMFDVLAGIHVMQYYSVQRP